MTNEKPGSFYQEILSWADFYYYQIGLNVIPVNDEKESIVKWKSWEADRIPNDKFKKMFNLQKDKIKGIGVILSVSKLVCLDFETKILYVEFCDFMNAKGYKLETWICETHRGFHVYFTNDEEMKYLKVQGLFERRLGSQYCVLPPSVHPDGGFYRWILSPKEIQKPLMLPNNIINEFIASKLFCGISITEDKITEEKSTEDKDKGKGASLFEKKDSHEFDLKPFYCNFGFLKECFVEFGFRYDAINWKMGKPILCVFHEEKSPSAKFVRLNDGKVGYREFHAPETGIKTYLGSTALVSHLLDYPPEKNIPQEKIYFLLRGIIKVKSDLDSHGAIFKRTQTLKTMLSKLDPEKELSETIQKSWLFIEVFSQGNGGEEFFISCRDLAKMCRLESHNNANRILNFLCLSGFMEKNDQKSNKLLSDRYHIVDHPEPNYDLMSKLAPLDSLNPINKNHLVQIGFTENFLNSIFRRKLNTSEM